MRDDIDMETPLVPINQTGIGHDCSRGYGAVEKNANGSYMISSLVF